MTHEAPAPRDDAATDGPLAGRRILVTRPGPRGEALAQLLAAEGADPLLAPLTRIEMVDRDGLAWRLAAQAHDWVLFTSVNAVRAAADAARVTEQQRLARALARAKVAAVGRVTAEALHDEGVSPLVVPGRFDAEALLEALAARDDVRGQRFLHPAAAGASEVLGAGLAELGAEVETIIAYASVPDEAGAVGLRAMRAQAPIDLATFFAPSAVEAYVAALGPEAAREVPAAAVGPVTAAALVAHGIPVVVEPREATAESLVGAIVDHYIR